MHDYKWLLFDLDGTLFDYDAAEKSAFERVFSDHGIPCRDHYLGIYREVNHKIWSDFEKGLITQEEIKTERFRILSGELNLDFDSLSFSRKYLQFLSEGTQLIEGAEQILAQAAEKYHCVLVTNGLKEVQRPRISASALKMYFREVIISEEIGYAKPDPRFFDTTFERIGHPRKREVLIIGDSLTSDMLGGHRYDIGTCWYNPGASPAQPEIRIDYEIQSLMELMEILDLV